MSNTDPLTPTTNTDLLYATTVKPALQAQLADRLGITPLDAEPNEIKDEDLPVLFTIFDRAPRTPMYENSQVTQMIYRSMHVVIVASVNKLEAELDAEPFINSIPAAIDADPTLGLVGCQAWVDEVRGCIYKTIGGRRFHALIAWSNVDAQGVYGSGQL